MVIREDIDLPVKLGTDLILSAVFELRFSVKVPSEAVFGIFYPVVVKKYPHVKLVRLPITHLPEEIRQSDPNLKYQPYYRLDIGTQGINIGSTTIQFFVQKPYIGWEQWQTFIIELLPQFICTGSFEKIERTGLRFINFTEQNLYSITNTEIKVGNRNCTCQPMTFRTEITEIKEKQYTTILQLVSDAIIETFPSNRLSGSVIDIEVIRNINSSVNDFQNEIDVLLNESHKIAKNLFFEILQPDFLKTLKPTYKE
ncbi:MAG: TIGR04255 family protein [Planctomycetaceae bacterium]|jgi:uncharacterized protein (TIGR04255 family)|nr:TIGR04255 family protein [Planctomycetaceae bacterium]